MLELVKFVEHNRDSLEQVIDLIPTPVFVKDLEGHYLACNRAFETFVALEKKDVIRKTVFDICEPDQAEVIHAQDEVLFQNAEPQAYEADFTCNNGQHHFVRFHKTTFADSDGRIAGLVGVIFDITEKTRLELELRELALTDTLTGLLNRRAGLAQLERELQESARKSNPFVVAFLDFDGFKTINDNYGHQIGDQLLKSIGETSATLLRGYDFLFRYGGEEFVLCLPDTEFEDGLVIAQRLRVAFRNLGVVSAEGSPVSTSVSIGLATYPEGGADVAELIKAADEALYEAKRQGGDTVVSASTIGEEVARNRLN